MGRNNSCSSSQLNIVGIIKRNNKTTAEKMMERFYSERQRKSPEGRQSSSNNVTQGTHPEGGRGRGGVECRSGWPWPPSAVEAADHSACRGCSSGRVLAILWGLISWAR